MTMTDQLPPQDIDAERALLGSILINAEQLEPVMALVQGRDFYREAHRFVYDAMVRLYLDGSGIDYALLCAQLRRDGTLDQAGGEDRVVELASATPTPFHAEHYARLVARTARLRDVIQLATQAVAQAYHPDAEVGQVVETATLALERLGSGPASGWAFVDLAEDLANERARLETVMAAYARDEPVGLPTNWPVIDRAGVFMRGELVLLVADPGMGKTAILLNLLERYCGRGIGVLVAEFEMSISQVLQRLMASLEGVWATNLRTGNLTDDLYGRAVKALARIDEWPLTRFKGPVPTASQLHRIVRRHLRHQEAQVLLVDYLQLIPQEGHGRSNEAERLGDVSTMLKRVAYEHDLLVIAVASTNRAGDRGGVSDLDRIRGSGQLGFDADWVLTMKADPKREDQEDQRVVARKLVLSKARHGQANVVQWLGFDRPHQRITPIDGPTDVDNMMGQEGGT